MNVTRVLLSAPPKRVCSMARLALIPRHIPEDILLPTRFQSRGPAFGGRRTNSSQKDSIVLIIFRNWSRSTGLVT